MVQYKIWRSLTEPLSFKGINLEYLMFVLLASGVIYTLSLRSLVLSGVILFCGLVAGYIFTRKDKKWFFVVRTGLFYFGVKIFQRRRYVR